MLEKQQRWQSLSHIKTTMESLLDDETLAQACYELELDTKLLQACDTLEAASDDEALAQACYEFEEDHRLLQTCYELEVEAMLQQWIVEGRIHDGSVEQPVPPANRSKAAEAAAGTSPRARSRSARR